jgi:hypothetical protein
VIKLSQLLTALAALGAAACSKAQSQDGAAVEAKLPGGFAQLSNVVELADGRVAFADTRDRLFLVADLTRGTVDTLGTPVDSLAPTAPPDQYKFPGWVAHLAGDTIALVDFSAIRTTLWNEQGKSLGVLPLPPVAGRTPVLAYDQVGHGYKIDYQSVLGGGEPGAAVRPDSIPVLRINLVDRGVDTVARLAGPEFGQARFGEQVQEAAKVFAPNDFFGVLPNGTAWVARGRENRVDWRSPEGRWRQGQHHDFTPQAVTQADRDRVLAQVRERGKQFGMPQELQIEYPFAETKPPFDFALGRPEGEVWLQRPRSEENAPLTYDVFDSAGKWHRAVTLPAGAALAGFGRNDAVYVTLKAADGTKTVGRMKIK